MNSAIETKLSPLDDDKPDWIPVKFGDVAFEPKESAKDAVKEGIEHVVGLEHIKTGDIHLRHSNSIDKSTTFSKKFSPGDLLFGRRRAYLKKDAQAQFTSICSGDIIVMRAKDALMPELLPFIVNNDKFFDWAITHSAGGLSPRCKFKDLANYEFLLPPMEQQAEIAKLLWAADTLIDNSQKVLNSLILLDLTLLKFHFYDDSSSKRERLKNIVSMKKGKKPSVLNDVGEGLPYATAGYLRVGEVEKIVPAEAWENLIRVNESDILVLWDGSNAGEILYGKDGFLASTMCKLELTNDNYIRDFIFQFLRFRENDIRRATVGSAIPHVDPGIIENIQIPSLNIKKQKEAVMSLKEVNDNIDLTKEHITHQKRLQKSLINQIF